jgi:hypothetical protein
MIPEFNNLTDSQIELLLKAPILVSILIAGADGEIDKNEIKHSILVTEDKQAIPKNKLSRYYKEVSQDFEDKLKIILASYPKKSGERNLMIEAELKELNDILSKIDQEFAVLLYNSYKEIAQKVAQSSGGVLGFNSVGIEEAKLVELPMIHKP